MPRPNADGIKDTEQVVVACSTCTNTYKQLLITVKRNRKKHDGLYVCRSCLCKKNLRPQNTTAYWTPEKRKHHASCVTESELWQLGVKNTPKRTGELNHMFGKTHTSETRLKMSNSRRGKTGVNATAWKGGRTSLNQRIKGALQRNYKWFHRVIDRDGCCQQCNAAKKLDAHHITPLSLLTKQLTKDIIFETEEEKYNWLICHPVIVDEKLQNGITLCRSCHKQLHANWGSHAPQIRTNDEV